MRYEKKTPLKKVNSGKHIIDIDAGEFAEGYYFYKMITPDFTDTKQMIMMR